MTILWMDGFDLYAGDSDLLVNYSGIYQRLDTAGGRFGGGGYHSAVTNIAGYIYKLLGASYSDIWTSVAFLAPAGPIVGVGVGAAPNNGVELYLNYNSTAGSLQVVTGSGRVIASVNVALSSGWHWLDFHVVYSATVGVVEVWVDNVQLINATGVSTVDNSGYSGTLSVYLFGGVGEFDDLFVYTPGTRLGDSRIETIVPASDASPNNGTPSTGTSHFGVVDEPRNNTSNYITMANTSGNKEVFGVGAITSTPVSVWAVKVEALAEKSDAGSYQLAPLVISGSTENDGTSQQLTTSYGVQQSIFATDPATSAAWTYSAVNAMKIGVKVP